MKRKRFLKRTGIVLLAILLLFLLLNLLFPLPDKVEYSVMITDDRDELLHAYLTKDEKWRFRTELSEISPLLQKTIILKEDRYFFYHPGFNPFSIGRAAVNNILNLKRSSGASTITMQVARALEPKKRSLTNKMLELFRAIQLELKYSKKEILQLYLNLVPMGGNIEGIKTASLLYLKKNPDHLSLAEITALSIIPNRPSSLVPGKHNDRIMAERNKWLYRFEEAGFFTKKEIRDALEEPFNASRNPVPQRIPHLAQKLRTQGGYHIQTNINQNTQSRVETLVADYSRGLKLQGIQNAAVVVIDNSSGDVISYIGSADFRDTTDGGQVNGAAAIRQPGSTLKPLLYAQCIDKGFLTPQMAISDVPVSFEGYAPENFDKQFNGSVSMEYSLAHSLNIPAVKSLRMIGKDEFVDLLSIMQFRQVQKDRKKLGLSMILGGCGSNLEELAGLYSCFANEGKFKKLQFIKSNTSNKSTRVMSSAASYMITEILSKVNRPDFPLNWQATERMPKIAWKTGTSYGRRDAWSIGYNKKYTVAVWAGNFSGQSVASLSGAQTATPLLFRIFNTIDYDSDEEWYHQPDECENRLVCAETGLPPADYCPNVVTDHFIPLVSPSGTCNNMQEIAISPDEKVSYCKSCQPSNGYKKKWFKVVTPEMQHYLEERKIAYNLIPAHNENCESIFRLNAPSIRSPQNGSEYLISRKNPEPLKLACNTSNDVATVHWYINNRYYKSSASRSPEFFVPDEGPVKISCTDDKGRNRDIWIRVRFVDL